MFPAEGKQCFLKPCLPQGWAGWDRGWGQEPRTHLDRREHEAHDEVGEPVHSPVHHEGGRPGGLQEDLGPHHGGDGTSRAESTGPVERRGLGGP